MNNFDDRYDIRLATMEEIDECMMFLDQYWKKGHIMAVDRRLFEYEYVVDDQVNIIIAKDRKSGLIEAFFGFILCSVSDPARRDVWGSMWKVNTEHDNMPLLGIELAKRVYPLTGCRVHIGNGANPDTTIPIRKLLFREKTGKMKQYYMLNNRKLEFEIAVIKDRWNPDIGKEDENVNLKRYISINELTEDFDLSALLTIPYKDSWYINKRYFMHPYYDYQVCGIEDDRGVDAIIVMREVSHNDTKVLRIVDYLGNQQSFKKIGVLLYDIMQENGYEYIDFFELGFDEEAIKQAGFRLRGEDGNIIPNYFEPFLQENVDIWVHYKDNNTLFFKADGDQDRPNRIR